MRFLAIIFDMDGTVVDSEPVYEYANKLVLESRGIFIDEAQSKELARRLHGGRIDLAGSIIKQMFNLSDSADKLSLERANIVNDFYEDGIRLVNGFVDFYEKVCPRPLKTAIASNVNSKILLSAKKSLHLDEFFGNHMYCVEDVNFVGKPEPDIYLYAVKQLGVFADNCIVIEDSPTGIKAAKNAGMFCIGINTGGDKEVLFEADMIVESYSQIDINGILGL